AAVLHGKRDKIDVGQLLWPKNACAVETLRIEEGDVVRPESMLCLIDEYLQTAHGFHDCQRITIFRLRDDPDKPVLGQGTGRPTVSSLRSPPFMRILMLSMIRLKQRDQHIDVEKRPHGSVVLVKPLLD